MTAQSNARHILSVNDLSESEIKEIFSRAKEFKEKGFSSSVFFSRDVSSVPVVALAFFEPSTRTKLSFDAAAQRLGLKTIGFDNPESTSSAKGEQLFDTLKVIEQYADAIVIRRKEHDTPDVVKSTSTVPVISAGVGAQEHPTQGLLDVFTISEHRDIESVNHVVSYGDLANSRTVYSQVRMLARPGITFSFVASEQMQISDEFQAELIAAGANVVLTNTLDDVIGDADILHVIRPQRERWGTDSHDMYATVDLETMKKMKKDALLMSPLPRVGELDPATDSDSRSIVWQQVKNGMFVRAAILEWILTN